jgi:hypothetical protein
MKSLIWKEWRETRWLTIILLALFLLSALCWKVVKPGDDHVIGLPIWTVLALFLGARAFAGEKQTSTMEFLSAQPLRKAHLWAIKAGWGFAILIAVVAISCLFDYMLMRADPFYSAFYLLEPPLSWILLSLAAVYSVALLSSTICDKTVVALGLAAVLSMIIAGIVIAMDPINRSFCLQLISHRWGAPLLLLWLPVVLAAGSFTIFAWREMWAEHRVAATAGAVALCGFTGLVLVVVCLTNTPVRKVTRITELYGTSGERTYCTFSVSVSGERQHFWRIDLDGENLIKGIRPGFLRRREHPAWSSKRLVAQTSDYAVSKIISGEDAGGYLIETKQRPLRYEARFAIPRRVRTTIRPVEGSSLSWWGLSTSIAGRRRAYRYEFYFVEEPPNGHKHVRMFYRQGDEPVRTARIGALEAMAPNRWRAIFSTPSDKGAAMICSLSRGSRYEHVGARSVKMDGEIRSTISFVNEAVVRFELDGKTFLADADNLARRRFEVPEGVLSRGPDALRRLAEGLMNTQLQLVRNLPQVSPVLESVAAGWGVDVPEELFDKAIFLVPRGRQIVYLKKENDQQSSLWLLDVESGESKKVLDDIDVTSPAVAEALVAPIMSDYLAFVRDTKTIWTYRDGELKQIFPPRQ